MIKLTVNPETQPCAHSFRQSSVVIGLNADLNLPEETLLSSHVKIIQQDGRFFILNLANDPFVTLNNHPFGKKLIKNNDLIIIGQTPILFTTESESFSGSSLVDTEEKLNSILEQALQNKSGVNAPQMASAKTSSELDTEGELQKLEELASNYINNWNDEKVPDDLDIDALLRQVEELETPLQQKQTDQKSLPPSEPQTPEAKVPPPPSRADLMHQKGSLKDYYLRELDDEHEQYPKGSEEIDPFRNQSRWNWKYIGIAAALLFILIATTFTIFYLNATDKINEDELKAAAGVADVSMALTYAQMNHGKPQNLNWSDPEFIKNNLLSVLAPKYNPIDTLDSHGQFSNNSYFIRIYTSSDLSHFLVIAQPEPSILHWLIPRASIVVDSKHMEMRRIDDLKSLNRVLLNPNTLDGTNHTEVSQIIQQGELIPLSYVADKAEKHGFSPPKFLGSIRPGAENLIYNAPRYYPFGESFLKKALMLSEHQGSSQEVALLQNQLKALEKYSNLVLYSAIGMQRAVQAQKALNTFLPHNKLLVAYLKLNSKGIIISSNLLMDDAASDIAMASPVEESPLPVEQPKLTDPQDIKIGDVKLTDPPSNLETTHPLLMKLCALQANRQHTLHAFETQLATLLEEDKEHHTTILELLSRMELLLKKRLKKYQDDPEKIDKTTASVQFLGKLHQILQTKDEQTRLEEQDLIRSLSKLYEDYGDMPLADFMKYIKTAGFESFVDQHLKLQNKNSLDEEEGMPQKEIEAQIQKIKTSASLAELSQNVDEMAQILNLEKFPNPAKVIAYQARAKVQVLDKLNDFLLSSEKGLPASDFTEENRSLVSHIMKTSWVTSPDEVDFYMNEFDARFNKAG